MREAKSYRRWKENRKFREEKLQDLERGKGWEGMEKGRKEGDKKRTVNRRWERRDGGLGKGKV